MGVIGRLLAGETVSTIGQSVTGMAEVFRPNATKQLELGHKAYVAALSQHGTEFEHGRVGWFDRLMNGLNRLPRPMLALGTLGFSSLQWLIQCSFLLECKGWPMCQSRFGGFWVRL